MIKVTLKDGKIIEVLENEKVIKVVKDISPSLAKQSVACKLDGVLADLSTVLTKDVNLEIITTSDKEALEILNHSCAHLLAEACKRLYKNVSYGVGPAIEEGFYYDMALPKQITLEDTKIGLFRSLKRAVLRLFAPLM